MIKLAQHLILLLLLIAQPAFAGERSSFCSIIYSQFSGKSIAPDFEKLDAAIVEYQKYVRDFRQKRGNLDDSNTPEGPIETEYTILPQNKIPRTREEKMALWHVLGNAGQRKLIDFREIFTIDATKDTFEKQRLRAKIIKTLDTVNFSRGIHIEWDPLGFSQLRVRNLIPWIKIRISDTASTAALSKAAIVLFKTSLAYKVLMDEKANDMLAADTDGPRTFEEMGREFLSSANDRFFQERLEREMLERNWADGFEAVGLISQGQRNKLVSEYETRLLGINHLSVFGQENWGFAWKVTKMGLRIATAAALSYVAYDLTGLPIPVVPYLMLTKVREVPQSILDKVGRVPFKDLLAESSAYFGRIVPFTERGLTFARKTIASGWLAVGTLALLSSVENIPTFIQLGSTAVQAMTSSVESRMEYERENFVFEQEKETQLDQTRWGFLDEKEIPEVQKEHARRIQTRIEMLVLGQTLTTPFQTVINQKAKNDYFKKWVTNNPKLMSQLKEVGVDWAVSYAETFAQTRHRYYIEVTENGLRLFPQDGK